MKLIRNRGLSVASLMMGLAILTIVLYTMLTYSQLLVKNYKNVKKLHRRLDQTVLAISALTEDLRSAIELKQEGDLIKLKVAGENGLIREISYKYDLPSGTDGDGVLHRSVSNVGMANYGDLNELKWCINNPIPPAGFPSCSILNTELAPLTWNGAGSIRQFVLEWKRPNNEYQIVVVELENLREDFSPAEQIIYK